MAAQRPTFSRRIRRAPYWLRHDRPRGAPALHRHVRVASGGRNTRGRRIPDRTRSGAVRPSRRSVDSPTRPWDIPAVQVGADGSSKLPQRLLPVVVARRVRGLDTAAFAIIVAIWIAATAGIPLRGATLPPPKTPSRRTSAVRPPGAAGLHHLAQMALGEQWEPPFVAEVTSKLRDLVEAGPGVLEATAVTARAGRTTRAFSMPPTSTPSCAPRSPRSTSPGARCAWSFPTPPALPDATSSGGDRRRRGRPRRCVYRRHRTRHPHAA